MSIFFPTDRVRLCLWDGLISVFQEPALVKFHSRLAAVTGARRSGIPALLPETCPEKEMSKFDANNEEFRLRAAKDVETALGRLKGGNGRPSLAKALFLMS